jgi:two-component system phosphate regulon sensor histidine kinase PhoR
MNNTRKIFIVLTLIVLLPALFYSVYEISSLNDTEEMILQLYERQMDAVLFSVNQYLLDVVSGWATQIENALPSNDFGRIVRSNSSILSVIVSDTAVSKLRAFPSAPQEHIRRLRRQKDRIEKLIRYQTASYRKLEPVIDTDSTMIILFIPSSSPATVVGIIVDTDRFISDVVGRKLTDIAQNDFVIAVVHRTAGNIAFATSPVGEREMSQQRPLWIFPDYAVRIRLQGTTIQEAANERFAKNIVLILLMDAVLILGAWFVFRMIRREMELVALKSDFVSNVSHELRTPLSLIRMFAETLEMGRVKTETKKKEYYGIILHETERLTRLINNILNFSRMESKSRKYHFRKTDINSVAASVLAVYSYQFEQLHFAVETSFDSTLPPIDADEEAIAEALHNLVDNAIKYSGEEKFLRLATQRDDRGIVLSVSDRGIGIPAEHRTKIFEKFYRVSHGLVHTAKGSGLGLAIVQHIVQSHRGTITIESTEGKGSTFSIHLPLTQT